MLTTANNQPATDNRQPTTNKQQPTTFALHLRPAEGNRRAGVGSAAAAAAGRTSQAFDEQKVAYCKSKSNLPYGCHSLQIVRAQNLTMTNTNFGPAPATALGSKAA